MKEYLLKLLFEAIAFQLQARDGGKKIILPDKII